MSILTGDLGFVRPTAARRISLEDSLRFGRMHERTYLELGFRLIDVPRGSVADRANLVQETLRQTTDCP
jgi:predicted ATPase